MNIAACYIASSPPNINQPDEADAPLIYAAICAKCSDDGHTRYVNELRKTYIYEETQKRRRSYEDQAEFITAYIEPKEAKFNADLSAFKTQKSAYDLQRLLSGGIQFDGTPPTELEEELRAAQEALTAAKQNQAGLAAKQQSEVAALNTQYRASFVQATGWTNGYYHWKRFAYRQAGMWRQRLLKTPWQHDYIVRRNGEAVHQKYLADQKALQADYPNQQAEAARQVQEAEAAIKLAQLKIQEYKSLQAQIPTFNRIKTYLSKLQPASVQSAFFAGAKVGVDAFKTTDTVLQQTQNTELPYQDRIAELERQLVEPNELTWDEYLQSLPKHQRDALLNSRGNVKDNYRRGRSDMLKNQNYWDYKLGKHLAAIASSRMAYTPEYEALLRGLQEKAADAEMDRLSGWAKYYKDHPDVYQAKRKNLQAELGMLKAQQAEYQASLEAQAAHLNQVKSSATSEAWQNYQWLTQTAVERQTNSLTDKVVAAEVSALSGVAIAAKSEQDYETERTAMLANQGAVQAAFTPETTDLNAIITGRFKAVVDRKIEQMKRFASPEGRARTDMLNNNASEIAGNTGNLTGRLESTQEAIVNQREAITTAANNQDKRTLESNPDGIRESSLTPNQKTIYNQLRERGLAGGDLRNAVTEALNPQANLEEIVQKYGGVSVAQVNEYGEVDTRNTVEFADRYGDLSSENPASVIAFKEYLATRSLEESSENPVNFVEFKEYIAQKKTIEDQLTTQLTEEIVNLGQTSTEDSLQATKDQLKEVQGQTFDDWVQAQLEAKRIAAEKANKVYQWQARPEGLFHNDVAYDVKSQTIEFCPSSEHLAQMAA